MAEHEFDTETFRLAGFTWRGADPRLEVRARHRGQWTAWTVLDPTHDMPDPTTREGVDGRRGSMPLWVGSADGVQVRVGGVGHRGLQLVLIDPGLGTTRPLTAARRTMERQTPGSAKLLKPEIRRRAEWGADDILREGDPNYTDQIRQVHLHHTVNSNDYRRKDVAALIRGAYVYHTLHLGWSDLGYNFVVDRFGRAWEGRAGGMGRRVRGAHTLGFNEASTGIAALGNFETAMPSAAMTTTIAQLAAWKLTKAGREPSGEVEVLSSGSDRYRSGTSVLLPVIDGHRDTNSTACPGKHLYAQLPAIRDLAQRIVDEHAQAVRRHAKS